MNTLHLNYVLEVAKTGSITLAAENLYMNQPNLSKAIKELENSLGIEIFKRTPKGVVPTKKGEEFLSYARRIVDQVEEMEAVYRPNHKNRAVFHLSAPRASYISHAFTLFADSFEETKELELYYHETSSMQTVRDVAEGEYRLGIIRYQESYENYFLSFLKEKGLQQEVIWNFHYLVLMSAQNPFAEAEPVTYDQMKRCVEIIHGDITVPHLSPTEAGKDEEHIKRRIYVFERGSQLDILHQIPKSYMWVSPLPQEQLDRYHLVQKNCPAANQLYKDVLIYKKGYKLSKIDKTFLERLYFVRDHIVPL